jgi:hypothetical protein
MSELINVFVDGEVSTQEEAINLLCGELHEVDPTEQVSAYQELRANVLATATRLCSPTQAAKIRKLLKEGTD